MITLEKLKCQAYDLLIQEITAKQADHQLMPTDDRMVGLVPAVQALNEIFQKAESIDYELSAMMEGLGSQAE